MGGGNSECFCLGSYFSAVSCDVYVCVCVCLCVRAWDPETETLVELRDAGGGISDCFCLGSYLSAV